MSSYPLLIIVPLDWCARFEQESEIWFCYCILWMNPLAVCIRNTDDYLDRLVLKWRKVTWELKSNSLRCSFIFRKTKNVYIRVFVMCLFLFCTRFPSFLIDEDTKSNLWKLHAGDTDVNLCLSVFLEIVDDDLCVCEYSDDVNMSWICISKLRPFRFRTVPFFRGSSPASYWVNDVKVSSAFGGEVKSGAGIFVILYCLEMQMFSLLKYLILV